MNDIKKILTDARQNISKKENWYKGYCYNADHDTNGIKCMCSVAAVAKAIMPDSNDPYNDLFCETGWHWLEVAEGELAKHLPQSFLGAERRFPISRPVTEFNDHPNTTHEDVLKLFDDTIKSLEETA